MSSSKLPGSSLLILAMTASMAVTFYHNQWKDAFMQGLEMEVFHNANDLVICLVPFIVQVGKGLAQGILLFPVINCPGRSLIQNNGGLFGSKSFRKNFYRPPIPCPAWVCNRHLHHTSRFSLACAHPHPDTKKKLLLKDGPEGRYPEILTLATL